RFGARRGRHLASWVFLAPLLAISGALAVKRSVFSTAVAFLQGQVLMSPPAAPYQRTYAGVPSGVLVKPGFLVLGGGLDLEVRRIDVRRQVSARPQSGGSSPFGDRTLEGKVKSYNAEKGFGFVSCDATFGKYQRDVFLHKEQAKGLAVGDMVKFKVEVNMQGNPQARQVSKLVPEVVGITDDVIDDAWAAFEQEDLAQEEVSPESDPWAQAEQAWAGVPPEKDPWAA
ncbi:unnamed protein product, partial [Polarella glacialis]